MMMMTSAYSLSFPHRLPLSTVVFWLLFLIILNYFRNHVYSFD
jgi:hypothetical protein